MSWSEVFLLCLIGVFLTILQGWIKLIILRKADTTGMVSSTTLFASFLMNVIIFAIIVPLHFAGYKIIPPLHYPSPDGMLLRDFGVFWAVALFIYSTFEFVFYTKLLKHASWDRKVFSIILSLLIWCWEAYYIMDVKRYVYWMFDETIEYFIYLILAAVCVYLITFIIVRSGYNRKRKIIIDSDKDMTITVVESGSNKKTVITVTSEGFEQVEKTEETNKIIGTETETKTEVNEIAKTEAKEEIKKGFEEIKAESTEVMEEANNKK